MVTCQKQIPIIPRVFLTHLAPSTGIGDKRINKFYVRAYVLIYLVDSVPRAEEVSMNI